MRDNPHQLGVLLCILAAFQARPPKNGSPHVTGYCSHLDGNKCLARSHCTGRLTARCKWLIHLPGLRSCHHQRRSLWLESAAHSADLVLWSCHQMLDHPNDRSICQDRSKCKPCGSNLLHIPELIDCGAVTTSPWIPPWEFTPINFSTPKSESSYCCHDFGLHPNCSDDVSIFKTCRDSEMSHSKTIGDLISNGAHTLGWPVRRAPQEECQFANWMVPSQLRGSFILGLHSKIKMICKQQVLASVLIRSQDLLLANHVQDRSVCDLLQSPASRNVVWRSFQLVSSSALPWTSHVRQGLTATTGQHYVDLHGLNVKYVESDCRWVSMSGAKYGCQNPVPPEVAKQVVNECSCPPKCIYSICYIAIDP